MTFHINYQQAKNLKLLFHNVDEKLILTYCNDLNLNIIQEINRVIVKDFEVKKITPEDFEELLSEVYQNGSDDSSSIIASIDDERQDIFSLVDDMPVAEDLLEGDDDAPIIKLINALLLEAINEKSSDIHIETHEDKINIRFRVDGVLKDVLKPNRKLSALLISRIKIMAKLDISEKRVPQDGRVSLLIGGKNVDVRVSSLPSSHGERIVLRLLDKSAIKLNLGSLGMTEENSQTFKEALLKPHGILLVTGPTGSGKSTTLYAGIQEINSNEKNIMTVEDPIEFDLNGINQTQVNSKVDMTFARGLRAILRQDPDVVLVGEIRDKETADVAIQASLTGHLVLSTLHTNTAVGAVTRLKDIGIPSFLISTSLLGVIAQRLVRTLCQHCKKPVEANYDQLKQLGKNNSDKVIIYQPLGCDKCNFKGYSGRTGIHEFFLNDPNISKLINDEADEQKIIEYIRQPHPSLQTDAVDKVLQGITSLEEILRVVRD